jgi:hypothetical protein
MNLRFHLSQNAHGVSQKTMRRNLRLVFHEKTVGAKCDWCFTVGYAAQFATGVPRKTMRRKMRLVSHGEIVGAKCETIPQICEV